MRTLRTGGALLVACLLGLLPLAHLSSDRTLYLAVALIATGLVGTTTLLRWLGAGHGLTQSVQVVVGVGLVWFLARPTGADTWFEWVNPLATSGVRFLQESSAPMPAHAGAKLLLMALAAVVVILTTLIVVTLEQPAWGISALATPFLIASVATLPPVSGWYAAGVLAGYVVLLAADSANRASSSVNVASDSAPTTSSGGRVRIAATVAVPAIAGALILGSVLPTGHLEEWLENQGPVSLQLSDPSIELSANLNQPSNAVVYRYKTSHPGGVQLRLTSLSVIDEQGARLTSQAIHTGALPTAPGQRTGLPVTVDVQMAAFSSEYLLAPYAPVSFTAEGEWGWDADTMTILAMSGDRRRATAGLNYSVSARVTEPTLEQISAAGVGTPPDAEVTSVVPDDLPAEIRDLAREIAGGSSTAGQKALAFQSWLRDPARFRYDTRAPSGTGYQTMLNFLFTDRAGYCVHFATAMATMARVEGIPSRVAIGFLPGTLGDDGWYEVRARSMHAWPELYLEGLGWVPFEPTAGAAGAPAWTDPTPSAPPSESAAPEPTAPTASSSPQTQPSERPDTTDTPSSATTSRGPVWPWALGVLLVAAAAAPGAARLLLRRRRLAARQPAVGRVVSAWDETRDTWLDLGDAWPDGPPRTVGATIARHLPDAAAAELTSLSLVVERCLFAKEAPEVGDVETSVATVSAAMREGRTPWTLLKAGFLPRSLWLRLQTRLSPPRGIDPRRHDGPL